MKSEFRYEPHEPAAGDLTDIFLMLLSNRIKHQPD